jgi:hypothetical protein
MAEIGELKGFGLNFGGSGFLEENSEKGSTRESTENRVAR